MLTPGGPAGLEPRLSPDGSWWWDGRTWRPAISPDGQFRWDGHSWQPRSLAPHTSTGVRAGTVVVLIAAIAVVVLASVSILGYVALRRLISEQTPPTAINSSGAAIPCDQLEHTQVHYHAAVQILDRGNDIPISTDLGRTPLCYYWLHMHSGEPGIIHIESPAARTFTLGDFFAVWHAWSGKPQPLDAGHVSSFTLGAGQSLVVYVDLGDGTGPQLYKSDPAGIVLTSHEVITIEISPPSINPPPTFVWPPGF
jgi:hypothetical protein